jgi:hypothetical protein
MIWYVIALHCIALHCIALHCIAGCMGLWDYWIMRLMLHPRLFVRIRLSAIVASIVQDKVELYLVFVFHISCLDVVAFNLVNINLILVNINFILVDNFPRGVSPAMIRDSFVAGDCENMIQLENIPSTP